MRRVGRDQDNTTLLPSMQYLRSRNMKGMKKICYCPLVGKLNFYTISASAKHFILRCPSLISGIYKDSDGNVELSLGMSVSWH